MPAQWTGELIGRIHNAGFTIKEVAIKSGLHEKYVSQVLNSNKETLPAREKLCAALDELIKEREGK